jgi:hypothetical protein
MTPEPAMTYTIHPDGDLLRARIWGRETDDPPSHICKAILEEGRKHGLKRILVELNQKRALSGASQYLLVEKLPALGLTYEHRIALVHHTPGLYEANAMIDLVAGNRSINVRNFRDVRSATEWLRSPAL